MSVLYNDVQKASINSQEVQQVSEIDGQCTYQCTIYQHDISPCLNNYELAAHLS